MEAKTAKRVVVNRNHDDLHHGDHHNRIQLREHLRHVAAQRSLDIPDLSRAAGYENHWASSVFGRDTWRLSTIQHLCRTLKMELMFNVNVKGLKLAPVQAELRDLMAMSGAMPAAWRDEAKRLALADLGGRIREAKGVILRDQATLLTSAPSKIRDWEEGKKPDYLLVTAQRYFRALGHPLGFSLQPEDGACYQVPGLCALEPGTEERVHIEEQDDCTQVWNSLDPGSIVTFSAEAWQRWLREAQ